MFYALGTPLVQAGTLTLALAGDPSTESVPTWIYGCHPDPGRAQGTLKPPAAGRTCRHGLLGYVLNGVMVTPSEFTSAPFESGLTLLGSGFITVHYAYEGWATVNNEPLPENHPLDYELQEIRANGVVARIAAGNAIKHMRGTAFLGTPKTGTIQFNKYGVAPGSRLRLLLGSTDVASSFGNLGYGGVTAWGHGTGDSGITLSVEQSGGTQSETPSGGDPVGLTPAGGPNSTEENGKPSSPRSGSGALPGAFLMVLLLLATLRFSLQSETRKAGLRTLGAYGD